jgi:hypothetical protein
MVALLLIFAVAAAVVAAFALPQLRAGAPIFTDKGDRLARRAGRPLQPVRDAVWPRLRAVGRPVRRVLGAVTRPVMKPLVERLRPRVAPLAQAISRAVEEGSVPVVARPSGPVAGVATPRVEDPAPSDPSPVFPRFDGFEALRLRRPLFSEAKRPAA